MRKTHSKSAAHLAAPATAPQQTRRDFGEKAARSLLTPRTSGREAMRGGGRGAAAQQKLIQQNADVGSTIHCGVSGWVEGRRGDKSCGKYNKRGAASNKCHSLAHAAHSQAHVDAG